MIRASISIRSVSDVGSTCSGAAGDGFARRYR
jgi:hypothetical protein